MQPAGGPSQKVPVMLSIVIGRAVCHLHSQPAMCSDIGHDFTAQSKTIMWTHTTHKYTKFVWAQADKHTEIQQDQRTNVRTRIDADKITKEEGNANDLTLAIQPCLHHKATVHPEKNH